MRECTTRREAANRLELRAFVGVDGTKMERLIEEATEILGISGQYSKLKSGGWGVTPGGDIQLSIRLNEEQDRIVLEHHLGDLPRRNRTTLLETLLLFNHASNDLTGMRTGLTFEKRAVMLADLPWEVADGPGLAQLIEATLQKAQLWRQLFEKTASPGDPSITDRPL